MLPSSVQNAFYGIREYVTPVLKESNFIESGVLTPQEFVAAGDFLIFKCPTWSWESGLEQHVKSFLPKDKQYLITRNVPCYKRALEQDVFQIPDQESDTWVLAASTEEKHDKDTIRVDEAPQSDILIEVDPANVLLTEEDLHGEDMNKQFERNTIRTRTYDLFLTYDKYYQVPRLWLQGYDEQNVPLSAQQIFEDVSQEHARKTITMEPHPHLSFVMASIHPCKHANVMKKMIQVLKESAPDRSVSIHVEQYIILFLKFISSIIPTIDYDYTMSID